MTIVKAMSWNVWGRHGRWQDREQLIIDLIRANAPDICGFQETWMTAELNQTSELARELGMYWH